MASTPQTIARRAAADLTAGGRSGTAEKVFHALLFSSTVAAVLVLGVLLFDVLLDGAGRLSLPFLTSFPSFRAVDTGIKAALSGTVSLMAIVAVVAFPVGVGAALYLEEFAPDNHFTRLMEVNIANLAGVPSIVYGLLGSAVFVYILGMGRSLVTGGLTLTLLVLPVIIVAAREALRSVPRGIRDAGLALGATPWQVTRREVLPAALPGIMTGVILALSRAIGEAAPILVVGALPTTRFTNAPWRPLDNFSALPIQIFDWVKRPQEAFRVDAAAAGIIVLLVVLLVMNSGAIILRNRFQRRW